MVPVEAITRTTQHNALSEQFPNPIKIIQKQTTLEKTEGAIKNGQARESSNIQLTRHRTKKNKIQKQKTKTMSVGLIY
jgi:hypothetical protein